MQTKCQNACTDLYVASTDTSSALTSPYVVLNHNPRLANAGKPSVSHDKSHLCERTNMSRATAFDQPPPGDPPLRLPWA